MKRTSCIIKIKIANQEILLEMGSNISADNSISLLNNISVSDLRKLYSNIKDVVNFDSIVKSDNTESILKGEQLYLEAVKEAKKNNEFLTPLNFLLTYQVKIDNVLKKLETTNITQLSIEDQQLLDSRRPQAVKDYVNSLDGNLVLETGDFVNNMTEAYKQSPQTKTFILNTFFKKAPESRELFNYFTNLPGMETVKISIAYSNDPTSKLTGVYITPDNIIQVTVPDNNKHLTNITSSLTGRPDKKLHSNTIDKVNGIIIHELAHAVFTEFYKSNPGFRKEIKKIHTKFMDSLETKLSEELNINPKVKNLFLQKYKDVQEFITDVFISRDIIKVLNKIPSENNNEDLVNASLYDYFTKTFSNEIKLPTSVLDDIIKSYSSESLSNITLDESFQDEQIYMSNDEFRNMFHRQGIDEAEVADHISPRTRYDTLGNTNAKAYYIQRFFVENYKEGKFLKEAFFKSKEETNDFKLSRLHAKDLVLIPWVKYVKKTATEAGRWQEIGVVVDSKGKALIKNNKLVMADVTRDEKGEIIQNSDLGAIEERTNYAPVVYSNTNKNTIVIAKVNDALTKTSINTLSIPFDMVKGIRKYDHTYFDHTLDYEAQLKEQLAEKQSTEAELVKFPDNEDLQSKLKEVERLIANLQGTEEKRGLIERAEEKKEKIREIYRKNTFSIGDESSDERLMNVSEKDYLASDYTTKDLDKKIFAKEEDAVYRIIKTKKGNYMTLPNPKKFQTLYGEDLAGEFVKSLRNIEDYQSAISEGDLVRYKIYSEKLQKEITQWGPVSKGLTNGIEIATKNGIGMIIPYSKVDGYAKNLSSEWFYDKIGDKLLKQDRALKELIYSKKGSEERSTRLETLTYKSLKFNAKYNQQKDEAEEDAIERFDKNLKKLTARAVPYKTYVKVERKYSTYDVEEKAVVVKVYESTELILAKTADSFLTVRYTKDGNPMISAVPFEKKVNDNPKDKSEETEMLFLIDDLGEVKEVWEEYIAERESINDNFKNSKADDYVAGKIFINEGTPENPSFKQNYDLKLEPASYSNVYDFYDNVNGNIEKLLKGDVIRIKPSEGSDAKPFYRKVISVRDDGFVIVAQYNSEDRKLDSGFIAKKGLYAQAIDPKKILAVGLRTTSVNQVETPDNEQVSYAINIREDILEKRKKMFEFSQKDKDYNDFIFRTEAQARDWNKNSKTTQSFYSEFVPFTNVMLDKSLTDVKFINRKGEVTEEPTTWVMVNVRNGTSNIIRGIDANTTFFKASDILIPNEKTGYPTMKPEFKAQLRIGDWIVTNYIGKDGKKKQWAEPIERFDGDRIYVLKGDYTTRAVNLKKVIGVKTSVQNDIKTGFTRTSKIKGVLNLKTKNNKNIKEETEPQGKNSIEMVFKSPKDSTRAIFEITNRFKELNPDVKINLLDNNDLIEIQKITGFNYAASRAFILDGQVNINMDRASISDVIHEYTHLFLHTLKYDNYALYKTLITATQSNELYAIISEKYNHLNSEDLDEEVFVTVLGEYLRNDLRDKSWETDKKETFAEFSKYIADKAKTIFNQESDPRTIKPEEIMYMKIEDIINLVGDWVLNNSITDTSSFEPLEEGQNLLKLKTDLLEKGFLTQQCYV